MVSTSDSAYLADGWAAQMAQICATNVVRGRPAGSGPPISRRLSSLLLGSRPSHVPPTASQPAAHRPSYPARRSDIRLLLPQLVAILGLPFVYDGLLPGMHSRGRPARMTDGMRCQGSSLLLRSVLGWPSQALRGQRLADGDDVDVRYARETSGCAEAYENTRERKRNIGGAAEKRSASRLQSTARHMRLLWVSAVRITASGSHRCLKNIEMLTGEDKLTGGSLVTRTAGQGSWA